MARRSVRNSPQKFTHGQSLSCLILQAYRETTYRGVIEFLEVSDALPDYVGQKIIDAAMRDLIQKFALDAEEPAAGSTGSTGMETNAASAHFQSHSEKSGRNT